MLRRVNLCIGLDNALSHGEVKILVQFRDAPNTAESHESHLCGLGYTKETVKKTLEWPLYPYHNTSLITKGFLRRFFYCATAFVLQKSVDIVDKKETSAFLDIKT